METRGSHNSAVIQVNAIVRATIRRLLLSGLSMTIIFQSFCFGAAVENPDVTTLCLQFPNQCRNASETSPPSLFDGFNTVGVVEVQEGNSIRILRFACSVLRCATADKENESRDR